jgi:mono/diheme cytochrome c family protein
LKLPDGSPFMADGLRRYGFLPNKASPAKLPVGFTAAGHKGEEAVGMTCAACHTRQIEFRGKPYRIDGGPAIIDFQAFLSDLDVAVGTVLKDGAAFADFAKAVLGSAQPADEANLRQALSDWYFRYHTLVDKSLPRPGTDNPWGPGRVDAIAMIFNRLTGLDLEPTPPHVIEGNIERALAPTRYPFLWNAWKQDKTQWPGFARNTDDLVRLGRNIGQVFGVFADFQPKKTASGGVDYWAVNSTNLKGLLALEDLTKQMGSPRWPWSIDQKLARRGAKIFRDNCVTCHGDGKGKPPWKTQIVAAKDVRTDFRELELLKRKAKTGVLEGEQPFDESNPEPLGKEDHAYRVLFAAVTNSLLSAPPPKEKDQALRSLRLEAESSKAKLRRSFIVAPEGGYEARVLDGVWAAAPYLHNGSVPTLTELLEPAAKRKASFEVGPAYDRGAVGLAAKQTQFKATMVTTDCSNPNSGNSRCGHEYGTTLTARQKRALIEYLKKL